MFSPRLRLFCLWHLSCNVNNIQPIIPEDYKNTTEQWCSYSATGVVHVWHVRIPNTHLSHLYRQNRHCWKSIDVFDIYMYSDSSLSFKSYAPPPPPPPPTTTTTMKKRRAFSVVPVRNSRECNFSYTTGGNLSRLKGLALWFKTSDGASRHINWQALVNAYWGHVK